MARIVAWVLEFVIGQRGLILSFVVVFFFSSRRRHTRFDCDWSSDVCSSDLHLDVAAPAAHLRAGDRRGGAALHVGRGTPGRGARRLIGWGYRAMSVRIDVEIGRASCRERV